MAHVDDEQGIGQPLHLLDSTETALQLGQLPAQHQRLFLAHAIEGSILPHGLQLLEPLDGLLDRLVVGQHASEPAMIDVGHPAALCLFLDGLLCGPLGPHEQNGALFRGQAAQEIERLFEQGNRLFKVDNVNLVASAKDVGRHLGMPVTGLVAKVNAGLQHLAHGYIGHFRILQSGLCLHTPHIPTPFIPRGHPGTCDGACVNLRPVTQSVTTGFANRACALYHNPIMTTIRTDIL